MVPDPAQDEPRPRVLLQRGRRRSGRMPDAELDRARPSASSSASASRAPTDVEDGCVVRVPKAYPVYDSTYREHLAVVRAFVDGLENLQTIGRNGLHRYNNQDHVDADRDARGAECHARRAGTTSGASTPIRSITRRSGSPRSRRLGAGGGQRLSEVFAPARRRWSFGLATGIDLGCAAAARDASRSWESRGAGGGRPQLRPPEPVLSGYGVSVGGRILGLLYGFAGGFVAGAAFAYLRNAAAFVSMVVITGARRSRGCGASSSICSRSKAHERRVCRSVPPGRVQWSPEGLRKMRSRRGSFA